MRRTPLRRSSPMPPQTKPMKRGRIRRRKRSAEETERIYGGVERIQFVRSLPCVVCGPASFGASQNAHIATGGMGRKADADSIVPLCAPHHRSLHVRGIETFQRRYGVDLESAAASTDEAWRRRQSNG